MSFIISVDVNDNKRSCFAKRVSINFYILVLSNTKITICCLETAFSILFCCLKTANENYFNFNHRHVPHERISEFQREIPLYPRLHKRKQKTDKPSSHFTIRKTQTVNTQFFIISLNSKVSTLIKHRTSRLSYNSCSLTPQISIYYSTLICHPGYSNH